MTLSLPRQTRADAVTWLTVWVFILYAIPTRLVVNGFGSAGAPSMLLGLGSFGAWSLYQLSRPTSDTPVGAWRPVRMAACAFLIAVGVSYAAGMTRPIESDEVSPALVAVLSVLSWTGTLLIANDGILSLDRLRALIQRLAWAGGLMGLLGMAQFATNSVLINVIQLPGLQNVQFESFARNGFTRPSGTAAHPIEFGAIIAMMLPIALHAAFRATGRYRLLQWIPVLVIAVSLVLTGSRSAYISGAAALVVAFLGWTGKQRRTFLIGFVVLAGLMVAAVPRLISQMSGLFTNASNDPSVASRTDSFGTFWQFFIHTPFFGRGLGTWLPKYRIFDNEYLGLLIGVGVIGTAAFFALAFVTVGSGIRAFRRTPEREIKDVAISLCGAVVAGMVSLATFDAFAFPMTMGTLFLLMGVLGALMRLTSPVSARPRYADLVDENGLGLLRSMRDRALPRKRGAREATRRSE